MTEETLPKKRVTPGNLLLAAGVVTVIQLVALGITNLNKPTYVYVVNATGPSFAPAGVSPAASTVNAFILVGFAFALTLGLVWLLRRKLVRFFKVIIFASVAIAAFVLTLVTADVFAVDYLPAVLEPYVAYGSAGLVVLLIGYIIFVKDRAWLSTALLAFVGAQVGSFFAETLPLWTALALPIAFAVYDIYAVFRGPLRALVGTAPNVALVGMSIKAGEFTLGLGDIVFYTLLPSLAYFKLSGTVGITAALLTMVAIDIGVLLTLYLLSKRRLLPGLPIPMLLGIIVVGYYLA